MSCELSAAGAGGRVSEGCDNALPAARLVEPRGSQEQVSELEIPAARASGMFDRGSDAPHRGAQVHFKGGAGVHYSGVMCTSQGVGMHIIGGSDAHQRGVRCPSQGSYRWMTRMAWRCEAAVTISRR